MRLNVTAALIISAAFLLVAPHGLRASQPNDAPSKKYQVLEAFPDKIQAKLENRDRFLKALPRDVNGFSLEYVIRRTKRWHPGQTLRVAFLGGDANLRNDIATTAGERS